MARWRADSKELMFVNGDGAVVAVDVAAGPAFQASAPKKLFQMPLDLLSNQNVGTLADATRDMQRLLMVMPVQESAQRELARRAQLAGGPAEVTPIAPAAAEVHRSAVGPMIRPCLPG